MCQLDIFRLMTRGLMRLRRTQPDTPRPFKVSPYPLAPILFVLATGVLIANALLSHPALVATNLLFTLSGVPIYFMWRRFAGASPAA